MSSIPNEKETFFGTNSFEKLKCSAFYPIQLAGIKFSKESMKLKQLLEIIIIKSRTLVLVLLVPAFDFLFTFIVWTLHVFTKLTGINYVVEQNKQKLSFNIKRINTTTTITTTAAVTTNTTTLSNKIENLTTFKTATTTLGNQITIDRNRNKINQNFINKVTNQQEEQQKDKIVDENSEENMYLNRLFDINDSNVESRNLEKTDSLKLLIRKKFNIRTNSSGQLIFKESYYSLNKQQQLKRKREQNSTMILIVYGCVAFVLIELLVLALALNSVKLPPGLVFLVFSLIFIGFILKKIFFMTETKLQHQKHLKQQLLQQKQQQLDQLKHYQEKQQLQQDEEKVSPINDEEQTERQCINEIKLHTIKHHQQLHRQQSEILLTDINKNLLNDNYHNNQHSSILVNNIRGRSTVCRKRPPFINFQNKTLSKVKIL